MNGIAQEIQEITGQILADYTQDRDIDRMDLLIQPDKRAITDLIHLLMPIIYPGYHPEKIQHLSTLLEEITLHLTRQLIPLCQAEGEAQAVTLAFLRSIPDIRAQVQTDVQAAYDGDPAATSVEEIIYCYPGLFAITVYRLAHVLQKLKVPMLPRVMTEYAHSLTGIDIHPGATIGGHFFIDHGTGIVIGETTVIGEHVKIYQGVTLGGLTTRGGQSLKGHKRHPTIEDHVTIYAGASILGGETVIGHHCVIGSNVFLTKSVPPCTTVTMKNVELQYKTYAPADHCQE